MNLNEARDLITGEQNPFVVECALRDLVARGWPTQAICAELPTVSEHEVRRARATIERAAA